MPSAHQIARELGGRKSGSGWVSWCPAHDDRSPSLSISAGRHGRPLLKCHAGCQQADVIGALKALGLWQNGQREWTQSAPRRTATAAQRCPEPEDDGARTSADLRIFRETEPPGELM